jgi:hypothetical protein
VNAHIPHHAVVEKHVSVPSTEFWRDWSEGRHDIVFWAWRFLGIALHPDQRLFARAATQTTADGWHVHWRDIAVSAGNQAGKTLDLAVIVLHHCFYKFGLRPPETDDPDAVERWAKAPYDWFHVSYRQVVARHVFREIRRIAQGVHPAQTDRLTGVSRGCPLTKAFPNVILTETIEDGLYEWVKIDPSFGGAQIHFRNTDEKAKSILGNPANGLSFDEAASEPYLLEIIDNVLHARRATTGGPIYYISTPDFNDFQFPDLWDSGDPESGHRQPKHISLRLSTRANIGYGMSQAEFDDLVANKDPWWIEQHIDGKFVEAKDAYFTAADVKRVFSDEVPEGDPGLELPLLDEQEPVPGKSYVQGCDVGLAKDPSPIVTLEYRRKTLVGVRIREIASPATVPAIINQAREGSLLFGRGVGACMTVLDSTGLGGKMFLEGFNEAIWPVLQFDFAGRASKKLDMLGDVKTLVEKDAIRLPGRGRLWQKLRRQMLGYRITDKKIEQDLVMALGLAVYHAVRNSGEVAPTNDFDYFGFSDEPQEDDE